MTRRKKKTVWQMNQSKEGVGYIPPQKTHSSNKNFIFFVHIEKQQHSSSPAAEKHHPDSTHSFFVAQLRVVVVLMLQSCREKKWDETERRGNEQRGINVLKTSSRRILSFIHPLNIPALESRRSGRSWWGFALWQNILLTGQEESPTFICNN